jgi:hypothetical protein
MSYRYLPGQLQPTADAVADFLRDSRGLQRLKVEEEINKKLGYRPTFHALTGDHYYVCVEVLESPFSATLESVVSDCMQQSLPVKLFVAFPGGPEIPDYKKKVDRAREKGVGVIEVTDVECKVIYEALALSLISVRPIDKSNYPPKYIAALTEAETTFRNGSPVKGCSILYDEIELLTRAVARRTKAKGMWRSPRPGEKARRISLEKGKWQKVVETLMDWLDWGKCNYLRHSLQRILTIIPHRNESGHKPQAVAARVKRDRELKTRFEVAADILADFVAVARPLRP